MGSMGQVNFEESSWVCATSQGQLDVRVTLRIIPIQSS